MEWAGIMAGSMTSPERAIVAANEAFYAAFASRDLDAMEALWSHGSPVCCIHPGWSALNDRPTIMASWASILGGEDAPLVRCDRVEVRPGSSVATVICEEVLGETRLSATNGFVCEDGIWRIWHHHAGPIARRVAPRPLLN